VERGHDPRDFALMAFGGAGALHLGALARELGIPRGLVPRYPSLFSAWGILAADLRHAYTQTVNRATDEVTSDQLGAMIAALTQQGTAQLAADGVAATEMAFAVSLDMRYAGQEHAVNVAAPPAMLTPPFHSGALAELVARFHAAHERAYTYALPGEPVVITNVRVDAIGRQPTPTPQRWTQGGAAADALLHRRPVLLSLADGYVETPVYDRERLAAGARVVGPCIIEEPTSTTVVHPGQSVTVDDYGNLVLRVG
jgi:N-methylhydantoinase A